MSNYLGLISLAISIFALGASLKRTPYQKHEYRFFLDEYRQKTGRQFGIWQKFLSWHASMGWNAPAWHWLGEVVSPQDTFKAERK
jgi:hypothetical protein